MPFSALLKLGGLRQEGAGLLRAAPLHVRELRGQTSIPQSLRQGRQSLLDVVVEVTVVPVEQRHERSPTPRACSA
jgi:hypothetical protein